jgi:hypothetical protein
LAKAKDWLWHDLPEVKAILTNHCFRQHDQQAGRSYLADKAGIQQCRMSFADAKKTIKEYVDSSSQTSKTSAGRRPTKWRKTEPTDLFVAKRSGAAGQPKDSSGVNQGDDEKIEKMKEAHVRRAGQTGKLLLWAPSFTGPREVGRLIESIIDRARRAKAIFTCRSSSRRT